MSAEGRQSTQGSRDGVGRGDSRLETGGRMSTAMKWLCLLFALAGALFFLNTRDMRPQAYIECSIVSALARAGLQLMDTKLTPGEDPESDREIVQQVNELNSMMIGAMGSVLDGTFEDISNIQIPVKGGMITLRVLIPDRPSSGAARKLGQDHRERDARSKRMEVGDGGTSSAGVEQQGVAAISAAAAAGGAERAVEVVGTREANSGSGGSRLLEGGGGFGKRGVEGEDDASAIALLEAEEEAAAAAAADAVVLYSDYMEGEEEGEDEPTTPVFVDGDAAAAGAVVTAAAGGGAGGGGVGPSDESAAVAIALAAPAQVCAVDGGEEGISDGLGSRLKLWGGGGGGGRRRKERMPVIVYMHGGGWVLHTLDTRDGVLRDVATASQAIVVGVQYRKAPHFQFPIPLEDSLAAWRWVVRNIASFGGDPDRIALMGDSAGATLALSMGIRRRAAFYWLPGGRSSGNSAPARKPCAVVAHSPPTSFCQSGHREVDGVVAEACRKKNMGLPSESAERYATGYGLLTKDLMEWFWRAYLPEPKDGLKPAASPLYATPRDLKRLAPTLLQSAEREILATEIEALHGRLEAVGVDVTHTVYNGTTHGFLARKFPGGMESLQEASDFVRRHCSTQAVARVRAAEAAAAAAEGAAAMTESF